MCDFIKYFISQLFFGLDFLNKRYNIDPPRCVSDLIIYIEARLFFGLDFSTKDTFFDPPRCVSDLIIYFVARLLFGLDFLNKWYPILIRPVVKTEEELKYIIKAHT